VQGQWLGLLMGKIAVGAFLVELIPGFVLLAVGLILIGLCHLPIRFAARVGLLTVFGVGIAVLRANSQWVPQLESIWIILGSMFVFRLMIYLYDLNHRTAPFSLSRSVAYFFMLPNVCFPLFPVVDYKTFCSTYYNEDWKRIYQTGLTWMLRGVYHLLLYRLIYQFAPLNVVTSAADVAGFVVGTYLLYLRISGQFHLIVGLLHMFGFNLPETHHLYYLASSFTDFWRRINIYWKDFIMKLFFYPSFFKLRKLGTVWALVLATLFSFFATWFLHSWQWFWIRGSFLFTWQDISFWTILALLVMANAVYETKTVRRRTLNPSKITLGRRFRLGLQTIGTFLVISILWTVWSSQSLGELQLLAEYAARPTASDLAIVLGGLAVIGVAGMIWGQSSRDTSEGRPAPTSRGPFHFWRSATAVGVCSACLFAVPLLNSMKSPVIRTVPAALRSDKANARDQDLQRRGYYEELDIAQVNQHRWRPDGTPNDWYTGRRVIYHLRSDFLLNELNPSVSGILAGAMASTDSLGLRDREYTREKPPGVHRMLLVGASHEMGTGVKDDETFENVLEDRLNREQTDATGLKYEILNLSVGDTSLFQKVARLEAVGFGFEPDVVILTVYAPDRLFILPKLSRILRQNLEAPSGYREFLSEIFRKAKVDSDTPDLVMQSRLRPYIPEMYEWLFRRFVDQCEQRGIRALAIYRPQPHEPFHPPEYLEIERLTRAAGLELIDLSGVFDSVADRNTLVLAKWDDHTNARGHKMLADALYERLGPAVLEYRAAKSRSGTDIREAESATGESNQNLKEIHELSRDSSHN
jgi:hypothetical protein